MAIHQDWGQVHAIVYLTEADIQKRFIRETLALEPQIIPHEPQNVQGLIHQIKSLDTPEIKTILFIAHGKLGLPGYLYNHGPAEIKKYLDSFVNKEFITLDFMSVCHQQKIILQEFKHLFTTSEKVTVSVGVQALEHSIEVYRAQYSDQTQMLVEGKTKAYKFHY